jgi:hypothetical protein
MNEKVVHKSKVIELQDERESENYQTEIELDIENH